MRFKPCAIENCSGNAHWEAQGKRGYCSVHYRRILRHGDPHKVLPFRHYGKTKDWFKSHVNYSGDDCLKWPFATDKNGYGVAHRPDGSLTTASHLMCLMAHGEKPSPCHETAHNCGKGNKGCVNPKHLYWATPQQNQMDRVRHGTSNRGKRQWQAKLSAADVRNIRAMLGTRSQTEIAKIYNVDPSHISDIKRRKNWAWLD